ncbi:metallophosphoesterase family protein [Candidatus Chromulinivorax destructor]|nr:metallophosphoesterase family protein [Candidatus Chromulinivorax destructor]
MNKTKKASILLFLSFSAQFLFGISSFSFEFVDRAAWNQACKKLPMNVEVMHTTKKVSAWSCHKNIHNDKNSAWLDFENALKQTLQIFQKSCLTNQSNWVNNSIPEASFYDISKEIFIPYIQKFEADKDDKIVIHGDFHGDIHSLIAELDALEKQGYMKKDSFELAQKNVYLVFLGDYVDRGLYGCEVMYTLFRLKIANPSNVIMIRGNHEDQNISDNYGFKDELITTFGSNLYAYQQIYRLYNFLPLALYLGRGNNYIQCCHGGLEYGYKPQNLLQSSCTFDLLGMVKRSDFKKYCDCCHQEEPIFVGNWFQDRASFLDFMPSSPSSFMGSIGFMWFDFKKFGDSHWLAGRGLAANEDLTQLVLDYQSAGSSKKVRGIMRAHQHAGGIEKQDPSNLMSELVASKGVYKLWRPIEINQKRSLHDGIVWTFNVAPDSLYGKFCHYGFDAYAIISIADRYEDWSMEVFNTKIIDCHLSKNK